MTIEIAPGLQTYYCNKCDASFNRLSRLEIHKKTHLKKALVTCNDCDKIFTSKSFLKQHRQLFHSKIKLLRASQSQSQEVTSKIDIQYLTRLERYFGNNDYIDSFKKECIQNLSPDNYLTNPYIKKNPNNTSNLIENNQITSQKSFSSIKSLQEHKSLHQRLTHQIIQEFPTMICNEITTDELITIL
jgi:hypothetical protein